MGKTENNVSPIEQLSTAPRSVSQEAVNKILGHPDEQLRMYQVKNPAAKAETSKTSLKFWRFLRKQLIYTLVILKCMTY